MFEPGNGVCQAATGVKECGQAGLVEWGPKPSGDWIYGSKSWLRTAKWSLHEGWGQESCPAPD